MTLVTPFIGPEYPWGQSKVRQRSPTLEPVGYTSLGADAVCSDSASLLLRRWRSIVEGLGGSGWGSQVLDCGWWGKEQQLINWSLWLCGGCPSPVCPLCLSELPGPVLSSVSSCGLAAERCSQRRKNGTRGIARGQSCVMPGGQGKPANRAYLHNPHWAGPALRSWYSECNL